MNTIKLKKHSAISISAYIAGIFSVVVAVDCFADGVSEPIPSYYQEPGISPNREYVNQHLNEHIDPFTGKLQLHYTDLFIPGNGGMNLAVQRSYTSLGQDYPETTPAGYGWTMHFGRILFKPTIDVCSYTQGARSNPTLELPDGGRQILYVALDGISYISTGFWKAVCHSTSAGFGGLDVFSPDGTRYEMTTPGTNLSTTPTEVATYYVSKITDRNGNWMSFTYDYVGQSFGVKKIITSDGRIVNFTYANGMISTISDGETEGGAPDNRTWKYISSGNFLTEVQRPDGNSWKYSYNPLSPPSEPLSSLSPGNGALRQLTYPTGGTIEYTYGFIDFTSSLILPLSTVVTKKVVDKISDTVDIGRGGNWIYTYKPATATLPSNVELWNNPSGDQVDQTTVTGPDGTRIYTHIGFTSAPSGGVFHIGKPVRTLTGDSQLELYSWNKQLISNQINIRPGSDRMTSDDAVYVSIPWSKNINRNGQYFSYQYDSLDNFGNPGTITETGTDTKVTSASYAVDLSKWILHLKKNETSTIAGEPIGSITRSFDGNGNLLLENRFGVDTNFTYAASGDVESKIDARGSKISYGNYQRGIPQLETHLLNLDISAPGEETMIISRTVDNRGNLISQTDGELATTSYQYDDLNRLTSITHPIGNPVSITWTANTRTTTRGNYKQVATFDRFGHETQLLHTDSGTNTSISQTKQYDELGRLIFTSYPNSVLGTRSVFDTLGQLMQVQQGYDPATGLALSWRLYDRVMNTVTITNERNFDSLYTYRGFSDPEHLELMSISTPEPTASISMKRNGLGQLTEVTQDGITRRYGYDARYFLTSKTDPETGDVIYGRDQVGNAISRKIGNNDSNTSVSTYDSFNRLRKTVYPDLYSVSHTYYRDGKVKSVDNGTTSLGYIYDKNKNLKTQTLTFVTGTLTPPPLSFATQYDYDGNDALNLLTYGSGKTVTYSPDAFGRPTKALPYVTAVDHHPTGQISKMVYANGVETTVGLNQRLWPSTLRIGKVGATFGPAIFDKYYGYDKIGNVETIDDPAISSARTMTYDKIDRLVTATGPWTGVYNASYDGRGNIKRQGWTEGATEFFSRAYTYDSVSERLSSVIEKNGTVSTPYNYSYDVYGNVTGKGAATFAYTPASTMRCSNCGMPNESLYDYDGSNMRVRLQKNGLSTYFVYGLGGNLLWEQISGTSIKEYIYLGGKQIATREKSLTAP